MIVISMYDIGVFPIVWTFAKKCVTVSLCLSISKILYNCPLLAYVKSREREEGEFGESKWIFAPFIVRVYEKKRKEKKRKEKKVKVKVRAGLVCEK